MAKKSVAEVIEETVKAKAEPVSTPDAEVAARKEHEGRTKKEAVSVYANEKVGGGYIRTYSLEEHGPSYAKLAEGFARKVGGSLRS